MTSSKLCQKMCSQTRNSCAKAFDNQARSKNFKPKKSRGGQFDRPPPPPPSRLLGLNINLNVSLSHKFLFLKRNFIKACSVRTDTVYIKNVINSSRISISLKEISTQLFWPQSFCFHCIIFCSCYFSLTKKRKHFPSFNFRDSSIFFFVVFHLSVVSFNPRSL